MIFKSLLQCINFLEKNGELVRIKDQVDPDQEMAEISRKVFQANGPAIFFENVKNSPFPSVSNIFGTYERALKILEPDLEKVKILIKLKINPKNILKSPGKGFKALLSSLNAIPLKKKNGPVLYKKGNIKDLPMIRCWPEDGGAFILLPQVFSQDPDKSGILNSNMGMYRIQISGNDYIPNKEIGLHYQIHRGIGNHHKNAINKNKPLKVSIFIGGPPAHTLAAIMPLPHNMPEVCFAGALAGQNFKYCIKNNYIISSDADFCITGEVVLNKTKKEGPFGDHLGYYSLKHDFPYLKVDSIWHKKNPIYPFTVVGRPPQEDSIFAKLIHDITQDAISSTISGVVTAIHAVDASGTHPLLLAKAKERYVPYETKKPREILTSANAILGFEQLSLAKYLLICAEEDNSNLDIYNEKEFFIHVLERIDFSRDLHFQTSTTIDTLDYSSKKLNQGSKVIMAVAGPKKRELSREFLTEIVIPSPFTNPKIAAPGILIIQGPKFENYKKADIEINRLSKNLKHSKKINKFPLLVITDDSHGTSDNFSTFLWTTFSKSNPSHDIYGIGSFIKHKHWGCTGSLIIDARTKSFHAPLLKPDKNIVKKVESFGKHGGPLYGII
ncbi:MAG: 3-octaprenyl-4-hydroxybenzoate carboxy-lyase [Desulfobacteraceae bacterium 4572_130]|nr:MAG: 3-octaprenyl-4-hydroxybenzoate carboxy-lyase [Desulfobacteraceae bacterium 4572_130]